MIYAKAPAIAAPPPAVPPNVVGAKNCSDRPSIFRRNSAPTTFGEAIGAFFVTSAVLLRVAGAATKAAAKQIETE